MERSYIFIKSHCIIYVSFLLLLSSTVLAQLPSSVIYTLPNPQSFNNHASTDIVIRFNDVINSIDNNLFDVVDNQNNHYKFIASILDDGKSILLHPLKALKMDSKITVLLQTTLQLKNNKQVSPFSFSFYTTSKISSEFINNELTPNNLLSTHTDTKETSSLNTTSTGAVANAALQKTLSSQIPISLLATNNSTNGYYFISTISYVKSYQNRCMIVDEKGLVVFEKLTNGYALDFKQLSNGNFCYFDWDKNAYFILDNTFNVIDTVRAGNGYATDNHELQFDKRTGHYFLLAQQNVSINMNDTILGGATNASVLGLIIQELDSNNNVVFEWKTLDHLAITDAVGINLLASTIDYAHCNAIEIDSDTTLLLSSRHLNEIERIDRRTGKLIWRLGQNAKQNMFQFFQDSFGFSYQHDIRRLPNGHITLFDDGNLRPGGARYSRALEYKIDEAKLNATLVWKYRNVPDVVSDYMGSVQRLDNGNTLICWGGTTPTFTEVDSLDNKVLEISMPAWAVSYRAFKINVANIVEKNQINIPLNDTTFFCNGNVTAITNNLKPYLIPANVSDSSYLINNNNGNVTVITQSPTNFFNYSNTILSFQNSQLQQRDTIICSGAQLLLSVNNKCNDLHFKWSTSDTTASINIKPTSTGKYWVEMSNDNFYNIDTINIKVSQLPNFSVLGQNQIAAPYQTLTYSVTYSAKYNYGWDVNHGNLTSGFNSNAVTVQWGENDSNYITSIITNENGCVKQASLLVLYKKTAPVTGINNLLLGSSDNKVFPNPTQDKLLIQVKGYFEYKLVDITGKIVDASTQNLQNETSINTSNLSSGCYLLYLSSADKTEHVKIIKE